MYCCRLLAIAASAGAQTYNAALNQPAFMSTTYQARVASLANDGNLNTQSYDECAYTQPSDGNPWWAVDLGAESTVVEVKYTIIDDTIGI